VPTPNYSFRLLDFTPRISRVSDVNSWVTCAVEKSNWGSAFTDKKSTCILLIMNKINKLYSNNHGLSSAELRVIVINFFKQFESVVTRDSSQRTMYTYEIAGLMESDFYKTLLPDDPLQEIFTIAGELEINPEDADELTQELIDKIAAL
jgi:hypothetical protein